MAAAVTPIPIAPRAPGPVTNPVSSAVLVPQVKSAKGGKGVAIFGGVLVLLLVTVGLYIMQKESGRTPVANLEKKVKALEKKSVVKTKSLIDTMVAKQGITVEEAEAERKEIIKEVDALKGGDCIFNQPMAGVSGITCQRNFKFDKETQCCRPQGDALPDMKDILIGLSLDLVKGIIIDELVEAMISIGIFLAAKLVALIIRMATKAAVELFASLTLAAVSGPVGMALLAFDMLSMAIDFLDPLGYDMFSANSVLQRKAEIAAYTQWTMVSVDKRSWPLLVSMMQIWPDAYENNVTPKMLEEYQGAAFDMMLKDHDAADIKALLPKEGEESDGSFGKVFKPYYEKAMGADPAARDKIIIDSLREGINENERDDVILVPAMSTLDRIGVSITQKKCEKWNKLHAPAWVNWINNLTGTETNKYVNEKSGELEPNEDANGNALPPPIFANWTDWCYVPDQEKMENTKWTEGEPPMKKVKLKDMPAVKANNPGGKDVWCALWSADMDQCFTMCTGKQTRAGEKGKQDITVYPAKYGVTWDNGQCVYTKKYCSHVNLKFKNNDCVPYPGQEFAEGLFGTTITREFVDWGTDITQCATKPSLGACSNAIAGPILKNTAKVISQTGKNIGGCFSGKSSDCGQILTQGPTAIPGKLLGGFGHGLAGLSSIGGDYTAALTAQLTFIGDVGDMMADPLGTLMNPARSVGVIARAPLAVLDGAAAAISHIPVIGGPIASVITGVTGIVGDGIDQALDMDNITATWWCPACIGVKLVYAGFKAIFGIKPKLTPQQKSDLWKKECDKAAAACQMKYPSDSLQSEAAAYCRATVETCPKINVGTYETISWGKPDEEKDKGNEYLFEDAGEDMRG